MGNHYSSFTAAVIVQPAKDTSCDTSLVKSAAKRRTVDIFNPVYRSNNPFYASCSSDDMPDGDEEKSPSAFETRGLSEEKCDPEDVGLSVPPCRKNQQCCVNDPAKGPQCMATGPDDGKQSRCRRGTCKTIS